MIRIASILLFLNFIIFAIYAQDCPNDNLVFNSQEDIDLYKITYPNCSFLNYSIRFEGEDIVDFSSFDQLRYVKDLYIGNCNSVTNIIAFNNLDSIGGDLQITSMDNLISLNVFASLKNVNGGLYITDLQKLDTIGDFPELKAINGSYIISRNMKLRALPSIDSVSGISLLAISENDLLSAVSGTYILQQPDPWVNLSNPEIESYENMNIESETIKRLGLHDHNKLINVKGFLTAVNISGELWITGNKKLVDFVGFESITHIEKQIQIKENNALTSCKGLENMSGPIDFSFQILDNESLETLDGLQGITEINSHLNIYRNNSLQNLEGLNNLEFIETNLRIFDNANMTSLEGLNKLDTINREFTISANPNLLTLQGLNNLDYVRNNITIQNNGLTDISSIGSMDLSTNYLTIRDNLNLEICSALSICNHLDLGLGSSIENNAIGCNTINEVLHSCNLPEIDSDNDGFNSDEDCDDNNSNINPAQIEIPYNGTDDDCNSETLDDDIDQDGFVLIEDCDDNNFNIHPNQLEIPYNGFDDDCNSETLDDDLDQDGFDFDEDCDDANFNINPNAIEIPNNNIDEDCDGSDMLTSTENDLNYKIVLYPNPSKNEVYINHYEGNYCELVNLNGEVFKLRIDNNKLINLRNLNPGVYQVRFKLESNISTKMLIKI